MKYATPGFLAVAVLLIAALAVALGSSRTPASQADQVAHIAAQLRCPVCDGESVAQSDSSAALAMKAKIASELSQGMTEQQILNGFQQQYGDWILTAPPHRGWLVLAWAAPAIVVAFGLLLAGRWVRLHGRPIGTPGASGTRCGDESNDEDADVPSVLRDYL